MKLSLSTIIVYFLTLSFSIGSVTICSWNLKDLGKTKSEQELNFIVETIKDFDIVAIQEVVAGDGGAQAVARLTDILNRKGNKWNYVISDPTFSSSYKTERYAYLWKPAKVKRIGDPWLEKTYKVEIDREPYYMSFQASGMTFTLVNFHAITKSKQPETEIKYFKLLPANYPDLELIFVGDFNLPQSHTVFNPLKSAGYMSALIGQKTTLKESCLNSDCLASEFDNIFYNKIKFNQLDAGVIHFYLNFETLSLSQMISDHLPVWVELEPVSIAK